MFRFVIWLILIYVVYKSVKYLVRVFSTQPSVGSNNRSNFQQPQDDHHSQYEIKKEDIVDAEFEDLENKKKNQSN